MSAVDSVGAAGVGVGVGPDGVGVLPCPAVALALHAASGSRQRTISPSGHLGRRITSMAWIPRFSLHTQAEQVNHSKEKRGRHSPKDVFWGVAAWLEQAEVSGSGERGGAAVNIELGVDVFQVL